MTDDYLDNLLNSIGEEDEGANIYYPSGPSRYVCSVIDEMRKIISVMDSHNIIRSKSILTTLVEECQTMVNRMEEGLSNFSDLEKLKKARSKLIKQCKELEKHIEVNNEK